MTEAEWEVARNPSRLLDAAQRFGHRPPARKLRLYIHACCGRLPTAPSGRLAEAVRICEEFADGVVSLNELNAFRGVVAHEPPAQDGTSGLCRMVLAANNRLWDAAKSVGNTVTAPQVMARAEGDECRGRTTFLSARDWLCILLRDILGNPFRPVTFAPDWRTDTALALARTMYESREFGAMPILADALQDVGCDSEDVLNHCRDANQVHVRGCWVIDLVLGKV